jgi:hypothetical protein
LKGKMTKKTLFSTSALLAILPLLATSCSNTDSTAAEPQAPVAETGTLNLPLMASVDGHSYHLSATFEIYRNSYWYYTWASTDAWTPDFSLNLQTGAYGVYMYSWQLTREDSLGRLQPIDARLVSSNYQYFTIYNGSVSSVGFQFETDGVIVTTGVGELDITVSVNEIAPVCTALGTDCGIGNWCPPAELTGSPLACVAVGATPVGQPCASPSDCVANASCIKQSSAAVCTALCGAAEFGASCESGGTCVKQGEDYGVCNGSEALPDAGGGASSIVDGGAVDGGAVDGG